MKIKLSEIEEGTITKEQAEALQKYFNEGGTWQQLLNLDEQEVEEVYAAGYEFYNEGEFDKALAAFATLVQLSPYVDKHWVAIGAAAQGKNAYKDALHGYEVALTLNPEHIPACFYAAQCCYALEDVQKSISYLEKVIEIQKKTGEVSEFAERAILILGTIPKERN